MIKSRSYLLLAAAILSANLGSSSYSQQAEVTKENRALSDLDLIRRSLLIYKVVSSAFPTTEQGLKALTTAPRVEPIPVKWRVLLEEIPSDPWDRECRYKQPSAESGKPFDLWSAGPDGLDGTADDIRG